MTHNIMIDIETLSTSTEAAVLSIGAVRFKVATGKIVDEFYEKITLESAMHYGKVDPDTLRFWLKQEDSVRLELTSTEKQGALHLPKCLDELSNWFPNGNCNVWANSPSFDLVILETMMKRSKKICPWNFWEHRCFRTIKHIGEAMGIQYNSSHDEAHNALEDAKVQANYAMSVLSFLDQNKLPNTYV